MRRSWIGAASAALAISLAPVSALADGNPSGSTAIFDGTQIDLSNGWGDAQACAVSNGLVQCFPTRSGLAAWEQQTAGIPSTTGRCSSPLRLFSNANYGGAELDVYDRSSAWRNLGLYGFDNVLSSYKVGACPVGLADLPGGGSLYPGSGTAGHWQASMLSGWNDRISGFYLP
jgi:hypothetical protein